MSQTTCQQAIRNWVNYGIIVYFVKEQTNNAPADQARIIKLICQIPPIQRMDPILNTLINCEVLSLSTNSIDKIAPLNGLQHLRILSLGRNQLKKIEKLEDVAGTLEELWASYNQISSLDGIQCLTSLRTLFMSNNLLRSFDELDKLAGLSLLQDVLFVGNPMYEGLSREEVRFQIIRRVPQITKIDGDMVRPSEKEAALSGT